VVNELPEHATRHATRLAAILAIYDDVKCEEIELPIGCFKTQSPLLHIKIDYKKTRDA
jgi:hypothetical protein